MSTTQKPKQWKAWLWLLAAIIYTICPMDLLPDIPVIGWGDDVLLLLASLFNLAEKKSIFVDRRIIFVLRYGKFIALGIVILIVLLLAVAAILAYKYL